MSERDSPSIEAAAASVHRTVLPRYSVLFWDFDGVIKESVEVKGAAFERLFVPFGPELAARVRAHHERHGGVSRYEKLRLYLGWAGQPSSDAEVDHYCGLFSAAVQQAVIDSAWVPGAREYLAANQHRQTFVLISATPQHELEEIVAAIGGARWFRHIYGAPSPKADAIERSLAELRCDCGKALVIGDSDTEFDAAAKAGVAFLLRRTAFNEVLQRRHPGPACAHFAD